MCAEDRKFVREEAELMGKIEDDGMDLVQDIRALDEEL
jgi:hypothetical protein